MYNLVPFSKYTSWCTSRMSPYFDFLWQRKGLCRTSIFTSASGSFPPLTHTSREEQSQLSTASIMLPTSNLTEKQQNKRVTQNVWTNVQLLLYVAATFHHTCCCRKSFPDWLLSLRSPAHRHTHSYPVWRPNLYLCSVLWILHSCRQIIHYSHFT